MRFSIFFVFILFRIGTASSSKYQLYNVENRPLLSFFVGNYQLPACLINCTFELKTSLMEFVYGDIQMDSRSNICRDYEQSLICVKETCINYSKLYYKLTSGLGWACHNSTRNPFESLFPCIVTMGKQARENHNCAESCKISNSTSSFPLNGKEVTDFEKPPNLITRMEDFCDPLACYMNCTRDQMNNYCPTSGSRLMHVPASAFDELIEEFSLTTEAEKSEILKNVPKTCQQFFNYPIVNSFRFDERFVYDLFFMITSRKQRTDNMLEARTEAEKIVMGIIKQMYLPKPTPTKLEWTIPKILTSSAMALVMFLNLIGVLLSFYWCLNNSEEKSADRRNIDGDMESEQFLEPNIRMKLKMPRMRSAAIKDSSQEVFELRVPRNGNNQSCQSDEQQQQHTIVVPRWKRRRTFSVPLEPRKRHDSTSSDQFPQIVIVKSRED